MSFRTEDERKLLREFLKWLNDHAWFAAEWGQAEIERIVNDFEENREIK